MRPLTFLRGLAIGLALLFAAPFVVPGVAHGMIIYVDDDNVAGPWDGTLEHPFQLIQDGVDDASPGDTVYVHNGTYYEHVLVQKVLELLGENKDSTVIDGNGSGDVVTIQQDSVSLTGFTVQNSGVGWVGVRVNFNHCAISGNNISGNGGSGIHLESSANDNVISDNNITNNSSYGVYSTGAWDNLIYHNNFIDNGQNAYDDGDNQWDSNYPEFGNYWSDYTGGDDWHGPHQNCPGGDQIGDEAYLVQGAYNRDRFPLMNPWDGTLPVPPPPQIVNVDDDFDESWLGWGYCRFSNIQLAIDAVDTSGTVLIFRGSYTQTFGVDKKIRLIGEDPNSTLVAHHGFWVCGDVCAPFAIYADSVYVSGLTLRASYAPMPTATVCVTSDYNTFTANKFPDLIGIYLHDSHHNNITDNVFTSSCGIRPEWSDSNIISGNAFDSCHFGIELDYSSGNEIFDNTFTNCFIGLHASGSIGSFIYHNTFVDNEGNAHGIGGHNTWDDGYPSGGNYWDDYTGSDEFSGPGQDIPGSDGIGDTPYTVSLGTDADRYPLMDAPALEGDANGDGTVNIADVIFLVSYLYRGGSPPSPPSAGDANCDGWVNLADVVYMINYLFRGGAAPGC